MTATIMETAPRKKKKSERRRREDVIKVRVDEAELNMISAHAAAARLTNAEFLRRLGQGHTPKSKVDLSLVRDLCSVAADLGRLGGLLKLWLSEKKNGSLPPHDIAVKDIDALWRRVQKTYAELKEKVEAL
ncbi:MAG TPA: hypothetical protein VE954_18850 [Oligoflexus sp.]|uniref:plasmid mobilization protein n=1 Tax=Oligoflexus sp. TaxID=1971216 RepID=UPI002D71A059|nr:hypothetical protein [Oligoflexus sp.]HYX35160.1 hypothetical protein [Oligoflexus sp.]